MEGGKEEVDEEGKLESGKMGGHGYDELDLSILLYS